MSDDPPPPLMTRLRARWNLSLAAVATIVVGAVLVVVALIAWIVYASSPSRVAWGSYLTWQQAVSLFGLWCLSCGLTYWTVRLWMQPVPGGDRRFQASWQAGQRWLAGHGVDLKDMPCFVVLGCRSRHDQEQLFTAGRHATHSTGDADAVIDWFLTDDCVLLICRQVGLYSQLLQKTKAVRSSSVQAAAEDPLAGAVELTDGLEAAESDLSASAEADEPSSGSGEFSDFLATHPSPLPSASQQGDAAAPRSHVATRPSLQPRLRPTMPETDPALETLDRMSEWVRQATEPDAWPQALATPTDLAAEPPLLDSLEKATAQQLLAEVCGQLKVSRFPYSPINGTLVVVDPEELSGDPAARAYGRAIRSDLEQLQQELGVASPVTTLVVEHAHPLDIAEFIRRLGRDAATGAATPHRRPAFVQPPLLGQAFHAEELPSERAMVALVDRALVGISHRVEQVLGQPEALTQPENHRLVRMAIRCRAWRRRLQWMMLESGATVTHDDPAVEPLIVAGLFMAGSGHGLQSEAMQAVLQHLLQQQNHLTWTASERRLHQRQQTLQTGLIFGVVLLAGILVFQSLRALLIG